MADSERRLPTVLRDAAAHQVCPLRLQGPASGAARATAAVSRAAASGAPPTPSRSAAARGQQQHGEWTPATTHRAAAGEACAGMHRAPAPAHGCGCGVEAVPHDGACCAAASAVQRRSAIPAPQSRVSAPELCCQLRGAACPVQPAQRRRSTSDGGPHRLLQLALKAACDSTSPQPKSYFRRRSLRAGTPRAAPVRQHAAAPSRAEASFFAEVA
jgi:hypothetical protein